MKPSGKDVGRLLVVMIMFVAMVGRLCYLPAAWWSSSSDDHHGDLDAVAVAAVDDGPVVPVVNLAGAFVLGSILGGTTATTATATTGSGIGISITTIDGVEKKQEDDDLKAAGTGKRGKVAVHIYVESLCIDSQRYMTEQVMPAYAALGTSIMSLSVVSFGNAKFNINPNNGTLSCQHGAAECDVNSYQQCAAYVYDDNVSRYLPFVACLFQRLPMGHHDDRFDPATIAACTGSLYWPSLQHCHDDPTLSWKLQKRAAAATPADHTYVPWVVIDGQHVDEASGNLVDMVCAAYRGPTTPNSGCPGAVPASGKVWNDDK